MPVNGKRISAEVLDLLAIVAGGGGCRQLFEIQVPQHHRGDLIAKSYLHYPMAASRGKSAG